VRFEATKQKSGKEDLVIIHRILNLQDEQETNNNVIVGGVLNGDDLLYFNRLKKSFVETIRQLKLKDTKFKTLFFYETFGQPSSQVFSKKGFVTVYCAVKNEKVAVRKKVLLGLEKVEDFEKEAYFPLLALFWPEPLS
jgi:hypothetical protein